MGNRLQALHQVNVTAFAVKELQLYLDTHPCDTQALTLFNQYKQALSRATAEYEAQYGPLTAASAASKQSWDWICDPWPWNYQ